MRSPSIVLFSLLIAGTAAAGENGSLHVVSFPDGAQVAIDGVAIGKRTPVQLSLPVGPHQVTGTVAAAGWAPATTTVLIEPGSQSVTLTLVPAQLAGPPGESVVGMSLPPGDPDCPSGGSAFFVGDETTYACHGAPGPTGPPGAAGPAGPPGPAGGAGAALVCRDADGQVVGPAVFDPVSLTTNSVRCLYTDEEGVLWSVLASNGRVLTTLVWRGTRVFTGLNCTGDEYWRGALPIRGIAFDVYFGFSSSPEPLEPIGPRVVTEGAATTRVTWLSESRPGSGVPCVNEFLGRTEDVIPPESFTLVAPPAPPLALPLRLASH